MKKILIENRLYNIKDIDYKKLLDSITNEKKKEHNDVLKEIEENYKIVNYIDLHNYY